MVKLTVGSRASTKTEPRPRGPINQRDLGEVFPDRIKPNLFYRSSQQFVPPPGVARLTELDLRRPLPSHLVDVDTYHDASEAPSCRITKVECNLVPTFRTGLILIGKLPLRSGKVPALWSPNRDEIFRKLMFNELKCSGMSSLGVMYTTILRNSWGPLRDALRVFAGVGGGDGGDGDGEGEGGEKDIRRPVLVHCIHGKDRTGIVVALISLLCGVSSEDVVNDYAASGPNLMEAKERGDIPFGHAMWLPESETVTPAEAMVETLSWLVENFGRRTDCREQKPKRERRWRKKRKGKPGDVVDGDDDGRDEEPEPEAVAAENYALWTGVTENEIESIRSNLMV